MGLIEKIPFIKNCGHLDNREKRGSRLKNCFLPFCRATYSKENAIFGLSFLRLHRRRKKYCTLQDYNIIFQDSQNWKRVQGSDDNEGNDRKKSEHKKHGKHRKHEETALGGFK